MKYALTFLFGGLVASSWWATGLWPHLGNGVLFVPAIFLSILAIAVAFVISTTEE